VVRWFAFPPLVDATISLSTWPQPNKSCNLLANLQTVCGLQSHEKPPGINRQAVENGKLCKAMAKENSKENEKAKAQTQL